MTTWETLRYGSDLFESYVRSILGAAILGYGISQVTGAAEASAYILMPLYLAGIGIVASVLGTFFVRTSEGGNPQKALHTGTLIAAALMIGGAFYATGFLRSTD